MSNVAIQAEHLSKYYKLGVKPHNRLKDQLAHLLSGFLARRPPVRGHRAGDTARPQRGLATSPSDYIWALKDVSFELKHGETLGVVGRNGAGKSTLLKILSRITEPTTGRAELYGRVGSLLEVGTGFDRELTGRENMYLNGVILGMTKREISRKADEIIDFSGVAKFIDTPVKHYSSGMQVRLAFAIAAHLEPEILIVDEVLAVGDAAFQKKCLEKMEEVAKHGRTVLFVSHNLVAVQELCNRGILLTDGEVAGSGTSAEVIAAYLNSLETSATSDLSERTDRQGAGHVRVSRVEIVGAFDSNSVMLATGEGASFTFYLTCVVPRMSCIFTIYDQHGRPIANFNSALHGHNDAREPGTGKRCVCRIRELLLLPGRYRLNVAVEADGELQDHVEGAAVFEVKEGRLEGRRLARADRHGSVYFKHQWTLPADVIRAGS
jgi:lipopolysaccharide transport system ATP-binding protein